MTEAYRVVCEKCQAVVLLAIVPEGEPIPPDVLAQGELLILDHEAICRATTRN